MKKIILLLVGCLLISSVSFATVDEPSIWAEDFVEELKAYNEIRSSAFGNYQNNITRGEFIYLTVKMIEIVQGEPIKVDSTISFSDTNDIYALKGASVGITSGIGNGKFGPDMLLTREQMATLLVNTLDSLDMSVASNSGYAFVDDDEFSSWASNAIYTVKANGIMDGVGNDTFNPSGNTTTEAAIVVVTKLIRKNIHKIDNAFLSSMHKDALNTKVTINNEVEVVMENIVLSNKPSINTLTFTYSQKNISDKDLPEFSLRVFFRDGSSELIKGFSKYYSPDTTKLLTKSLDYNKSKIPAFVIVETDKININLYLPEMAKWEIK